jgi:N-hydroxyarylamine O-acetyltransferase
MDASFDLHAYLDRIEWGGSSSPTYATLAGLVAAHTARVPFENLDVLLGRPVRLDLDSLQRKLVRDRRGGYCFEHATLMGAALDALGFAAVRHAARVIMFAPRHLVPRTHMFLVVALAEGPFVVDPGFGRLAARAPVPLRQGVDVKFGEDTHRIVRDGDHWTLQARVDGEESPCWTTPLDETHAIDFEVANHYTATHPSSPFRNRLMLRMFTRDGRVTVADREVTVTCEGRSQTSELPDRKALRALLADRFGVDLPDVEKMRVPSVPAWN